MDDFGYGGDASYDIEVGVGADGGETQDLPFDITHQTVNFTVNLRSGDLPLGDALPGATITVFADAAGATQIGTGMTDENGKASIRFARSTARPVTRSMRPSRRPRATTTRAGAHAGRDVGFAVAGD